MSLYCTRATYGYFIQKGTTGSGVLSSGQSTTSASGSSTAVSSSVIIGASVAGGIGLISSAIGVFYYLKFVRSSPLTNLVEKSVGIVKSRVETTDIEAMEGKADSQPTEIVNNNNTSTNNQPRHRTSIHTQASENNKSNIKAVRKPENVAKLSSRTFVKVTISELISLGSLNFTNCAGAARFGFRTDIFSWSLAILDSLIFVTLSSTDAHCQKKIYLFSPLVHMGKTLSSENRNVLIEIQYLKKEKEFRKKDTGGCAPQCGSSSGVNFKVPSFKEKKEISFSGEDPFFGGRLE
ncbi:unnamed protein product [Didymodactylos carnosus]|uniref:Uncharacterized protein n=1 Tax=Didymodactylos carnosus TaxID=1234261 RepID=A0A814YUI8_9BILA|nr:unnamed protein product [Didymodactylos carnosus]CAF1233716.1 unnamed protein product [Didymodactylos carnosus]CAF3793774.1 unnamed protein product [Didymodactylos carnosus]CAF3996301.1 unnamed protein product [Didymodactylos carnosus]